MAIVSLVLPTTDDGRQYMSSLIWLTCRLWGPFKVLCDDSIAEYGRLKLSCITQYTLHVGTWLPQNTLVEKIVFIWTLQKHTWTKNSFTPSYRAALFCWTCIICNQHQEERWNNAWKNYSLLSWFTDGILCNGLSKQYVVTVLWNKW